MSLLWEWEGCINAFCILYFAISLSKMADERWPTLAMTSSTLNFLDLLVINLVGWKKNKAWSMSVIDTYV